MTITYTGRVANARLGGFSRLLFYWKGSIYKLMYKEMLIFCLIYMLISIIYHLALTQLQMRMFERIALYCEAFTSLIPLSFILGFYVAVVVTRWWNQFLCIPWPDRMMIYVTTIIDGLDEQSRIVRRTLARYMTMASLIVFQATSVSVKKRFPTMDHLIEAAVHVSLYHLLLLIKFLPLPMYAKDKDPISFAPHDEHPSSSPCSHHSFTSRQHLDTLVRSVARKTLQVKYLTGVINEVELKALDEVNTPHGKWWVPFVWSANLVKSARKEGRIADDYLMKTVIDEMMTYRNDLGKLYSYDWISVPLVYTQVTTLAVYTFFGGCVFGRQFLDPSQNYPGHNVDLYVPVFTILQFFFYMGWLKVAEQLINPFGEDDDDFEMNWIIDRNMQISLLLADDLHDSFPLMEKDMYFGESAPDCLPYTKSSISSLRAPFMGSTANLSVSRDGMQVVMPMETIQEEGGHHLGSSPYSLSASRPASPFSTPGHTRRLHQNLMSGVHSQLSLSRSTLDVIKATDKSSAYKPVVQTLNGSYVSKAASYLEGLMHDATSSHVEVGSFRSCNGSSFQQQRFSRAFESDNNSACVSIDETAQTPRDEYVASPSDTDVSVNTTPQQLAPAHSVSFSIPSDVAVTAAITVVPPGDHMAHPPPYVVNASHIVNVPNTATEAPRAMEETPATQPASFPEPRCSTSSEESLMGYESPESNQSTVNSLTPLLQFGIGMASHGDAV